MTTVEPRMSPLPIDRWSSDGREMLRGQLATADRYLGDDPPPLPNILGLFGRQPRLTAPWLGLSTTLNEDGGFGPRDRELLILRVSWRTGCRYEWGQHVRMGRSVGVSDDEIVAVSRELDAGTWSARDQALLAATDQLVASHTIDDETWSRLTPILDEQQILGFLFIVGYYVAIALVMNGVGLPPDPGSDMPLPPAAKTEV